MTTPFGPGGTRPGGRSVVERAPGLDGGEPPSTTAEILLHQERLRVLTQRVASERVRISKRIVTTTRTIEVPVRLEQLVITRETLGDENTATTAGPGARPEDGGGDLVIVLHEEIPEVTLRVVAVERVAIGRRTVAGEQTITVDLAAEAAATTLDVT